MDFTIIYLEQKDIQESAEVHLPVLPGTLQMQRQRHLACVVKLQWQRHLCLCCQMAQIVSNTTTRKLNVGVKNVNAALKLNIAEDIDLGTSRPIRTVLCFHNDDYRDDSDDQSLPKNS